MKTITISKLTKSINDLLKQARKENIILRTSDGSEFILAEIDDFDREIELTRQNRELMKLLDLRAKQTETLSLSETKALLGLNKS